MATRYSVVPLPRLANNVVSHIITSLTQGAGRRGRAAGFHTYGRPWKPPLCVPTCSDQACGGHGRAKLALHAN